MLEIERKWRVTGVPADLPAPDRIRQGYLTDGDGGEVRLRERAGRCILTAKRGQGLVREEGEIEVTAAQLNTLWPLTKGRRLTKQRHTWTERGARLELDVYSGALTGLVVLEVEFSSETEAMAWQPPDWVGDELTGVAGWSNGALARQGAPSPLNAT